MAFATPNHKAEQNAWLLIEKIATVFGAI